MKPLLVSILLLILIVDPSLSAQDNREWTVDDIRFEGNSFYDRGRLIKHMRLKPSGPFRSTTYFFPTLVNDIDSLRSFYQQSGFVFADVLLDTVIRDQAERTVEIHLSITEGDRVFIDTIAVQGNAVFSKERILAAVELKPGSPLSTNRLEEQTGAIVNLLATRGHLFADISFQTEIDTAADSARVTYIIEEGPSVRAGEIVVAGNKKYRDELILRELAFSEGDTLISRKIAKSIQNLNMTTLFENAQIEPLDKVSGGDPSRSVAIPILVQVNERDRLAYSIDAGYDTYEAWYASLTLLYRNLFGWGHRISLTGRYSTVVKGGRLSYIYPRFATLPLRFNTDAFIELREYESYEGLFDGITMTFNGTQGLFNFFQLKAAFERVEWIDEPPPTEDFPNVPRKNTAIIGLGIGRDTRFTPFRPGSGVYVTFEGDLGGLLIPDTYQFYRLTGDIRGYYEVPRTPLSAASALFAGYANGYGKDAGFVPPQSQFRIGQQDVRSVRGYQIEEIMPLDENNNVRGGNVALILNIIEIGFPIWRWFSGAVFVDAGYAWVDLDSVDLSDLKYSTGPGLRADFPIGFLRLDYGIKLDGDRDLDGRFHFSIGLPF
ncbi:MAG: BamA/OMP85 family outer membrane protein [Chitinivibrionales bacterium]